MSGPCLLDQDFILEWGLEWANYNEQRRSRVKWETNISRFRSHYGLEPLSCACVWEDLQTTAIAEARVERKYLDLKYFLMSLKWLYRYYTDEELSGVFEVCISTVAKWKWFSIGKIAALKGLKVRLLELDAKTTLI